MLVIGKPFLFLTLTIFFRLTYAFRTMRFLLHRLHTYVFYRVRALLSDSEFRAKGVSDRNMFYKDKIEIK